VKSAELDPAFEAELAGYLFGSLPPDVKAALDRQIADEPALRREVDRLTEVLVATLVPALPPATPSPVAKARLEATLVSVDRFAPFWTSLSRLCDLPVHVVKRLVAKVDEPAAWLPGYVPGLSYFNFTPGLKLAGADAGFVRLEVGTTFPRHRHLGDELTFVLEGRLREGERVFGPGALLERARDSEHVWSTEGQRPLVTVSVHRGIALVGG
jgi:ChrR Cupin-like domain